MKKNKLAGLNVGLIILLLAAPSYAGGKKKPNAASSPSIDLGLVAGAADLSGAATPQKNKNFAGAETPRAGSSRSSPGAAAQGPQSGHLTPLSLSRVASRLGYSAEYIAYVRLAALEIATTLDEAKSLALGNSADFCEKLICQGSQTQIQFDRLFMVNEGGTAHAGAGVYATSSLTQADKYREERGANGRLVEAVLFPGTKILDLTSAQVRKAIKAYPPCPSTGKSICAAAMNAAEPPLVVKYTPEYFCIKSPHIVLFFPVDHENPSETEALHRRLAGLETFRFKPEVAAEVDEVLLQLLALDGE